MRWHIGLMTGTVLDGNIDVAFLRTDGKLIEEFGYYNLMPYDEEVKALLIKAINEAQIWNFNGPEPEIFSKTEAALTNSQTVAVQKCIKLSGIDKNEIEAVGFHGQTVLHKAPNNLLKGKIKIIGVGGVDSGQSAYEKFLLGADYIQLYTGMVFQGPNIAGIIKKELKELLTRDGVKNFSEIIGNKTLS